MRAFERSVPSGYLSTTLLLLQPKPSYNTFIPVEKTAFSSVEKERVEFIPGLVSVD